MLWLTFQQIVDAAKAGLMPGLPTTESSIRRLAKRERWTESNLTRLRDGRGGGLEYHIDLLPASASQTWLSRKLIITHQDIRPNLTDGPVNSAHDARQVVLRLAERFQTSLQAPQTASDGMFCDLFNYGLLDLPEWISDEITSLSSRTLSRWRKSIAEGGKTAKSGRPAASGVLDRAADGAVRNLVIAAIANQPFLKAKHVRALIRDKFGEELEVTDPKTGEVKAHPIPTVRIFQIALKRWRKEFKNEIMRLTDPDGYRSKIEFTATGSQRADRLNEVWQIDASPADVMLTTGRHNIYLAIDVYSRRSIILVTPTPRASGVGLLIRKCLLEWGVPERIHTDNGSDFVAHQTKRLFSALDIEIELSPPYQPKSKGIVERTIGTFQRDLATCPGFIGHSVADRKVIEQRKAFSKRLGASDTELFGVEMNLEQFQEWCDGWASQIYGHDSHAGLKGRTPFEAAASYAGPVRRIEHEAALDVLLAPLASGKGMRRVSKQGVRVDGESYLPMGVMPGTDVLVRMDPADAGRIMLFDPENDEFLGEAICAGLAGMDPVKITAKAKAMQKEHEQNKLVDIRRAQRRLKPSDVAAALQRDGQRRASVMVAFPQQSEEYSNPALDGAAIASGSKRNFVPPEPISPEKHEAFVAKFQARSAPKKPETSQLDLFQRALRLEDQIEAGNEVSKSDLAWLHGYKSHPAYSSQKRMFKRYGNQMFAG